MCVCVSSRENLKGRYLFSLICIFFEISVIVVTPIRDGKKNNKIQKKKHAVQILIRIALQFLYAVTKAWQGFRLGFRTLKIVTFLCKLTAGLTLLLTTKAEWAQ